MITEGIYIDDAGTPGVASKSAFLDESRKSWCAVVVPTKVAKNVGYAIEIFLQGVKQDYGVDELHFADVYGGRGLWNTVPVAKRIEIFDLMTGVLSTFALPVIFQTVGKSMYSDHDAFFPRYEKIPGIFWDIKNSSHLGLLLLCFQISRSFSYLKKKSPSDFPAPLPAYVDEGIARAGATIDLPNWDEAIQGKKLHFQKSVDNPGLQLADFAAFSISRTQWIAAKQERHHPISKGDQHIMAISGRLNLFNLEKAYIDPQNFSRDDYESFLMQDRVAKGLSARTHSDE